MAANEPPKKPVTAVAPPPEPFFTPKRTRLLSYVGGGVVVVGLAVWFMMTAAKRKETFAARALDDARAVAESGDLGNAVQRFTMVATQYKGTAAGYEAALGIAQAQLVNGQAQLAATGLEGFLKSNPPALYAGPANGLLGTCYENLGKWAEAAAAHQKAAELAKVDYLKATALLDAGRAFRMGGKPDQAIAAYREIVSKYSKTAAITEAQVRLAELVKGG